MAVLFKGMSKDNFVDGLVMKTGLNGHELFDYLMSILPEEKKEEKKEEPHYPTKDIARFYGTAKEAKDYLEILGADADTLKWFAASALARVLLPAPEGPSRAMLIMRKNPF